jgi:hypothetical protein
MRRHYTLKSARKTCEENLFERAATELERNSRCGDKGVENSQRYQARKLNSLWLAAGGFFLREHWLFLAASR